MAIVRQNRDIYVAIDRFIEAHVDNVDMSRDRDNSAARLHSIHKLIRNGLNEKIVNVDELRRLSYRGEQNILQMWYDAVVVSQKSCLWI